MGISVGGASDASLSFSPTSSAGGISGSSATSVAGKAARPRTSPLHAIPGVIAGAAVRITSGSGAGGGGSGSTRGLRRGGSGSIMSGGGGGVTGSSIRASPGATCSASLRTWLALGATNPGSAANAGSVAASGLAAGFAAGGGPLGTGSITGALTSALGSGAAVAAALRSAGTVVALAGTSVNRRCAA